MYHRGPNQGTLPPGFVSCLEVSSTWSQNCFGDSRFGTIITHHDCLSELEVSEPQARAQNPKSPKAYIEPCVSGKGDRNGASQAPSEFISWALGFRSSCCFLEPSGGHSEFFNRRPTKETHRVLHSILSSSYEHPPAKQVLGVPYSREWDAASVM